MNISFCLISNRPEKMRTFIDTFHHAICRGHIYQLHLSYEDEFEINDLKYIKGKLNDLSVKLVELKREKTKPFNCAKARLHSVSKAKNSDYIIICDDDFRFTNGKQTNHFKWSAGERYLDCIHYLEKHKNCAIVYGKGYLGGAKAGRSVSPMLSGYYETGMGLILPPPKYQMIHDDFLIPGAGFDSAMAVTAMLNGYYVAKALNFTINKDPTKKTMLKKGMSEKNYSGSKGHYSFNHGIYKVINETYGPYKLGKRFPQSIIDSYRVNAEKKKFEVLI